MRVRRSSGILLHPTSLPSPFGIGDIGPEAAHFIEWLASAGQHVWQVLPLGPTGYGDSPYAPFSSFAGNEILISPELLERDGWLTEAELAEARLPQSGRVDYGKAIPTKRSLIRTATERLMASGAKASGLAEFQQKNASWLPDYALFMDIKQEYDELARLQGVRDSSWNTWWPEPLARRDPEALAKRRQTSAHSIARVEAEQYLFKTQWDELRAIAAALDVKVLGDLPIFVAMDSADAWSKPELFRLDTMGKPSAVAGVPPDYFSADGQLWGNPLYAWERHEADGFAWWVARIEAALSLYDMVRIDHFRGLAACWAVPAGEKTARNGVWEPAPGAALLTALAGKLGTELPIIAEDLGFITEDVTALRTRFGLPGMRILQFGFDAEESGRGLDPHNPFLPHNYVPDCVAYTGTHDNDTLTGWLSSASAEEQAFIQSYLGHVSADTVRALLREAMKSAAGLAMFPMQDVLGLGSEARMNTPSTIGGNWSWRLMEKPVAGGKLAMELAELTWLYGRTLRKD